MAEYVFSCSYCGTTITKSTTPNQSSCPKGTSHYWIRLGEVGAYTYQCRDCSLVVNTKSTPSQSGCTNAHSHYWKKL
jgi:hypothetical protein